MFSARRDCRAAVAIAVLAACLSAAADELVLTPENTVILNAPPGQGRLLQYYLIKAYVGDKDAEPLHWAVRKAEPALRRAVNDVLAGWRNDGTLKRILDRWMPGRDQIQWPERADEGTQPDR